MSPKQFYEEFGGGSISRVDKNFKKLAEHGWLRYVRSETGGSRRFASAAYLQGVRRKGTAESLRIRRRIQRETAATSSAWRSSPFQGAGEVRLAGAVSQKTGGRHRSAVELFYRATGPAISDRESWAEAPDNHLSWSVLRLDRQGSGQRTVGGSGK